MAISPASSGGRFSARLTGPVNGCAADRFTTITPTAAAKNNVSGVVRTAPDAAESAGVEGNGDKGRAVVSAGRFIVPLRLISFRAIVRTPMLCDN
jgi:hypothetical protein